MQVAQACIEPEYKLNTLVLFQEKFSSSRKRILLLLLLVRPYVLPKQNRQCTFLWVLAQVRKSKGRQRQLIKACSWLMVGFPSINKKVKIQLFSSLPYC